MRLLITINLGNEAMQTADDVRDAVDEALIGYGVERLSLNQYGSIRDDNGNTVGVWRVTE